jgi:tRNA modification GTPase
MRDSRRDAIVALATPPLAAERAVLRLSGPTLLKLDPCLLPRGLAPAWAAERGVHAFVWEWLPGLSLPGEAWVFPGPHSATGEDVIELHLLGSLPTVRALESELLQVAGIRAALAGEFTRRAFLNGVLDLTQAEAVLRLVQSRDAAEARAAAAVLAGALGVELEQARAALAEAMVQIEAGLDFEEGDSQDLQPGEIEEHLVQAAAALRRGQSGEQERAVRETGVFRIGLVGAPNAGKTALFSRLTGSSALVADERGTTRDRLEAEWRRETSGDGPRYLLADGPGRSLQPSDARDAAAQSRARQADRFDLVWYLIDAADPQAELAEPVPATAAVVVFAKVDLARAIPESLYRQAEARGPVVWVSSSEGTGVDELERATQAAELALSADRASGARASQRHQAALQAALEAVDAAAAFDALGGHQDLVAEELRRALGAISELVGEFTPEDLLDQLFSSFCVGK